MLPNVDTGTVGLAVGKNAVAIIVAATVCGKVNKTVDLFFEFIRLKVFGIYLSVCLYVLYYPLRRKQKPPVAVSFSKQSFQFIGQASACTRLWIEPTLP